MLAKNDRCLGMHSQYRTTKLETISMPNPTPRERLFAEFHATTVPLRAGHHQHCLVIARSEENPRATHPR